MKFKTNIKCGACVEKVTPALNEAAGQGNWEVDTLDAQKVLTVKGSTDDAKIRAALKAVGYQAEKIS